MQQTTQSAPPSILSSNAEEADERGTAECTEMIYHLTAAVKEVSFVGNDLQMSSVISLIMFVTLFHQQHQCMHWLLNSNYCGWLLHKTSHAIRRRKKKRGNKSLSRHSRCGSSKSVSISGTRHVAPMSTCPSESHSSASVTNANSAPQGASDSSTKCLKSYAEYSDKGVCDSAINVPKQTYGERPVRDWLEVESNYNVWCCAESGRQRVQPSCKLS